MPIYAYRCDACGFRKDVLQKMSDPALTVCPSCGAESFAKQLSAPAFQLKGTGWYVTDFRDKGAKPAGAETGVAAAGEPAGAANGSGKAADKGESAKPADGKSNGKGAGAAAAPTTPAAAKPEAKGGGSGASAGTSSGGSGAS